MTEVVEKKKRGRKKKDPNAENITITNATSEPVLPKNVVVNQKGEKL